MSKNNDAAVIVKHIRPRNMNIRRRVRSFSDLFFVADTHSIDAIPRSACNKHTPWWLFGIDVGNSEVFFKIKLFIFWIL